MLKQNPQEMYGGIENPKDILENIEDYIVTNSHEGPAPTDDQDNASSSSESSSLENIFTLGYEHATKPNSKHWSLHFPKHMQKFREHCSKEKMSKEELEESSFTLEDEEEEEEWEEEDYAMDYDEEEHKAYKAAKESALKNQDKEDNVPNLEWVPVEHNQQATGYENNEVSLRNDHQQHRWREYFEACFASRSAELWANGLNFDNTAAFDEWFLNEWRDSVRQVRDFVQQNIYIDEMNYYRSSGHQQ